MALDPQDARLTAYAMGELDPREAAQIEAELAQSPEAAREVVEIRRAAEMISQALKREPVAGAASAELNAASRAMIFAAAAEDKTGAPSHKPAPGRSSAPRPTSPRRRLSAWARRHRMAIGLVAFAVCATAAVLPATWLASASRRVETLAQVESSPYWLTDEVQYAPPSQEFNVSREAAAQRYNNLHGDPSLGETHKALPSLVIKDQSGAPASAPRTVPTSAGQGEPASSDNDDVLRFNATANPGQNSEGKPGEPYEAPSSLVVKETQTGRLMLGVGVGSKSGLVGDAIIDPAKVPSGQDSYALEGKSEQGPKWNDGPPANGSRQRGEQSDSRMTVRDLGSLAGRPMAQQPPLGKGEEALGQRGNQTSTPYYISADGRKQISESNGSSPAPDNLSLVPPGSTQDARFRELSEEARGRQEAEDYARIVENTFQAVGEEPLSTFSIDVDTASYSNVRRFLTQGTLPPPSAVRIEELINYFHYSYAAPAEKAEDPFAAHADVVACPWAPNHRLVRIGIKGREIDADHRPTSNLVFLVDVSGSMQAANKLPLVKEGLRMLVEKLGENDSVAIVVYAGSSGLVLPPTNGTQKSTIIGAIDKLEAGGSTNGGAGIQLAYDTAVGAFIKGGANRVILATDGDFNVGTTDQGQLVDLIEQKAKSNVFLSVLGFGMGNLKDSTLEKLSDKGNGNYAYIDSQAEARKVLVEQLSGTLVTIAKDVKIQIEFNPAKVQSYRLIGYENRILAKEDFNDDRKDAGEIGAGHTVTALYEVIPVGAAATIAAVAGVDPLEYQDPPKAPEAVTTPGPGAGAPAADGPVAEAKNKSQDLLMLKLRYKLPDGDTSKLLKYPVADKDQSIGAAGDDCELAAAVAAFGMQLRGSAHKGTVNYAMILELAEAAIGEDKEGYRREFVDLVKRAQAMGR